MSRQEGESERLNGICQYHGSSTALCSQRQNDPTCHSQRHITSSLPQSKPLRDCRLGSGAFPPWTGPGSSREPHCGVGTACRGVRTAGPAWASSARSSEAESSIAESRAHHWAVTTPSGVASCLCGEAQCC